MKVWIPCRLFFSLALVTVFCAGTPQAWAAPAATTTTLTITSGGNTLASGGSVTAGSVVTLTAGVSSGSTQLTTGQVNFCDASAKSCTDIRLLGTAQLTSAGTAVFRFRPGFGNHSYKAVFAGTPNGATAYAGSTSSTTTLTVTATSPTTTAIAASGSAGNYSLTATVTGMVNAASLAAPAGTVFFLDSSNGYFSLGTANLGAGTPGLSFLNPSNPGYGQPVSAVTVGDFNGDGILDLILEPPGLSTWLGNGTGNFTPVVPISQGESGWPIAVGDFNGDGILDLAVVDNYPYYVSDYVYILLGNGDGTFTFAPELPMNLPHFPISIAVGDFNGDGIPDLVIVNEFDGGIGLPNSVTVWLGDGTGNFSAPSYITHILTGWAENPVLVVGDFNGDGIPDLAVANVPGVVNGPGVFINTVNVFLGDGTGKFNAAATNPVIGTHAGGMVAADFNGDGILDLAVTDDDNNTVTILLGNGDGTFTPTATSPQTGSTPYDIVVGDFNGDGIPDLAVLNNGDNTLTVLLGNGDGTFTAEGPWPQKSANFSGFAAGDFNGDGISDLAAASSANNTVTVLLTQLTQTATATVTGIAPLGSGTHHVEASYPGDSIFSGSTSAFTGLTAQQGTPTVKVTPSSASVTTAQQLTVTINVGGSTGNPTPTGAVTLTGGGYTSAATSLSGGIAQINVPAGSLALGADTLTASYSGDTNYVTASGAALPVTVTKTTPTVTVTPSSSNITIMQQLTVTIAVTSAAGNPTPTGAVTLTGGGYTSAATALTGGIATINVPAGSLAPGADTLTVSYPGDANYVAAAGTAPVTVTNPTFTITGTAVSVAPGAANVNTSTITVTPVGGFTGSVALAAAITSSPAGAVGSPTFSFGGASPVSILGAAAGTASLTISTTQSISCSAASSTRREVPWYVGGGAVLACVLLFGIPARRRSWRRMLGIAALFLTLVSGVLACGGSGGSATCNVVFPPATTAGNYTVTVTGTSGAITTTGTVALTVQ